LFKKFKNKTLWITLQFPIESFISADISKKLIGARLDNIDRLKKGIAKIPLLL